MADESVRTRDQVLVLFLGLFGLGLILPWYGPPWLKGYQFLVLSIAILGIGTPGFFLALGIPFWVVAMIGVHKDRLWSLPLAILALASMVCWAIFAHLQGGGEMLGPHGGLSIGYYLWLACGIGTVALAAKVSLSVGANRIRAWTGFSAAISVCLCLAYWNLNSLLGLSALGSDEIIMFEVVPYGAPIFKWLPTSEQPEAIAMFNWLDINPGVLRRGDAVACARIVDEYKHDTEVQQPERSRRAVAQLKAILEPYRHQPVVAGP